METAIFAARMEARYVRFSVRWKEAPRPRERPQHASGGPFPRRESLGAVTETTAIAAFEIAVVRERPLAPATMPLDLPSWDRWF